MTWLSRLFTRPAPSLPDPSPVAHLAAEVASLRHRMRQVERSLAEEQRYRAGLVEAVARLSRDVAWLSASESHAAGSFGARPARLELHFQAPLSDGAEETSDALDEALTAVAKQRAGGEA